MPERLGPAFAAPVVAGRSRRRHHADVDVVVAEDEEEVARQAANLVEAEVRAHATPVLGLATGWTPIGCYQQLATRHRDHGLSFGSVHCFLLDEYLGVAAEHPASCRATITRDLLQPVGISDGQVEGLGGLADDADGECRRYDRAIAQAGGIGLQLLGLGRNGHIGFNEPGTPLDSRAHVTALSSTSRADNAYGFGGLGHVPGQALTQGVATILEARRVVLLALGEHKADAVAAMVDGPVTPVCPASALQRHHQVTVLLDPAAASRLA